MRHRPAAARRPGGEARARSASPPAHSVVAAAASLSVPHGGSAGADVFAAAGGSTQAPQGSSLSTSRAASASGGGSSTMVRFREAILSQIESEAFSSAHSPAAVVSSSGVGAFGAPPGAVAAAAAAPGAGHDAHRSAAVTASASRGIQHSRRPGTAMALGLARRRLGQRRASGGSASDTEASDTQRFALRPVSAPVNALRRASSPPLLEWQGTQWPAGAGVPGSDAAPPRALAAHQPYAPSPMLALHQRVRAEAHDPASSPAPRAPFGCVVSGCARVGARARGRARLLTFVAAHSARPCRSNRRACLPAESILCSCRRRR